MKIHFIAKVFFHLFLKPVQKRTILFLATAYYPAFR